MCMYVCVCVCMCVYVSVRTFLPPRASRPRNIGIRTCSPRHGKKLLIVIFAKNASLRSYGVINFACLECQTTPEPQNTETTQRGHDITVYMCVYVCMCVYVSVRSFLPPRAFRPRNICTYVFTATRKKTFIIVIFDKNASFRSYGVICLPRMPLTTPEPQNTDTNGIHATWA